ncbi:MAG: helix-turn-helix domain-containing protein [Candidatus Eisenbacteria bacterium]
MERVGASRLAGQHSRAEKPDRANRHPPCRTGSRCESAGTAGDRGLAAIRELATNSGRRPIHRGSLGRCRRHGAPESGRPRRDRQRTTSQAASALCGHLSLRDARDAVERDLIRDTLARLDGNVTKAAEVLGLERTHLHKRIRHLGLKED